MAAKKKPYKLATGTIVRLLYAAGYARRRDTRAAPSTPAGFAVSSSDYDPVIVNVAWRRPWPFAGTDEEEKAMRFARCKEYEAVLAPHYAVEFCTDSVGSNCWVAVRAQPASP